MCIIPAHSTDRNQIYCISLKQMAAKTEQTKVLTDPTLDVLLNEVEGATPEVKFAITSSKMAMSEIEENMTLAGLVELRVEDGVTYGRLPAYADGHSVAISNVNAGTDTGMGGGEGDDEDMVDEDELLERDGLPTTKCPPMNADEIANAKSAGRKPCKDCSCGLASVNGDDDSSKKGVEPKDMTKSNCGNCSLGDAFRCAGCPFLGLPPFKPGEKVSISSSLMTSDI